MAVSPTIASCRRPTSLTTLDRHVSGRDGRCHGRRIDAGGRQAIVQRLAAGFVDRLGSAP
jgi:hypothetical protein